MHCPQPKIISINEDQPEYQVEDIIGRKNFKNGLKYLVKWKGYDIKQSTWQPINNLRNSIQFVKQYERRYKQQNQQNKNSIDMSFDGDAHESEGGKKKKRIFKEHLVFPKSSNSSIKKQEQKKIKKKEVVNKKQNTQNQSSKNYKFNSFDFGQSVDNFCIQVSEIQTPLQINNQLYQKMHQQIIQSQQKQDQVQGQAQSQSNSQKADQQQLPPSLNLTQYQNQQDYRIALQHLNPHINNVNRPANSQADKKLMRIQIPLSKLKIIRPEDIGKDYKISKIVNSQGKWFVQIQINGRIVGYVSAQLMKQINISLMLDYLYNITPLS